MFTTEHYDYYSHKVATNDYKCCSRKRLTPKEMLPVLLNYFRSSSYIHTYIHNTGLAKAWTANDRISVKWKSDLTDKIKRSFFPSSGRVHTAIWIHYTDAN